MLLEKYHCPKLLYTIMTSSPQRQTKEQKENGLKPFSSNYSFKNTSISWKDHSSLQSVLSLSADHSDVLGVGIFLPCLVVNVYPASAHALDDGCLAIHFYLISVNCG